MLKSQRQTKSSTVKRRQKQTVLQRQTPAKTRRVQPQDWWFFVSVPLHLSFCISLSFFLSLCVCQSLCLSLCLSLLSESLFLSGCLNVHMYTCLDQQQQDINNRKMKLAQNIANDQESLYPSF